MRKLIYSMSLSLDGFIADAQGGFDWSAPDEELHQFHNDRVRELGAHLLGRRLYEVMTHWDGISTEGDGIEADFARVWQALPKIVFSTTLEEVTSPNTRLATGSVAEEVAALKAQPGKDIEVGGAGLAGSCIELGLVDEFNLFVAPVLVGGGTPFFPPLTERVQLELVETRTFRSPVVYMRYRRVQPG